MLKNKIIAPEIHDLLEKEDLLLNDVKDNSHYSTIRNQNKKTTIFCLPYLCPYIQCFWANIQRFGAFPGLLTALLSSPPAPLGHSLVAPPSNRDVQ